MSDLNLLDLIVEFKDLCVDAAREGYPANAETHRRAQDAYNRIKFNLENMPRTPTPPLSEERVKVYSALNSERDYQDSMTADPNVPSMIEDMHLGDALSAIQFNLDKARAVWYKGSAPHTEAMVYLRKIGGLVVKMGERYGMMERKR